ncbi:AbfB domain-containing protein [Phytohabitans houttuyneae]|uniref:Alpha-L-arabinofuranosidase B arabinose-binding domain-containing protein n=1 Tax=Phytohabitans houttuyneae TaxID=1076126 RepID=A0A6V8KK60_9ACTN|nr:AbfB domain-containing protein [Phytohabitans houttuyneae]GFJ82137.1 hypothetical protein Phou_063170 [Phytohabitans houttuyneae]
MTNDPGYYLRHANDDLALVQNDGSGTSADDARFRRVAGWATPRSGWVA